MFAVVAGIITLGAAAIATGLGSLLGVVAGLGASVAVLTALNSAPACSPAPAYPSSAACDTLRPWAAWKPHPGSARKDSAAKHDCSSGL